MDDDTLTDRLNALGRLAEAHVAAGTADTGSAEITSDEADRIIASVRAHGATPQQILRVIDKVATAYRTSLENAAKRAA